MAIDIGLIAYDKYIESIGATHLNPWSNLGKVQQDAWRAAACAVLDYIHKCEEEMKSDPDTIG